MSMTVLASSQRDGWELWELWELTRSGPGGPGAQRTRYSLRGLVVTPEQAHAILYRKGRGLSWARYPLPGGWIMTLELSQEEAMAIWRLGLGPLAVLAPPLYARPLTREELMSA
jgi:hypothetical protein